ncbi:MAG: DUF5131 family protein [Methylococcales symbiont of Hymedesmia sp. n. MRB-2018]|nr:MAG: DUF5131 family protein [Methylococcales symbiont of Hymedesmia sp. n. MRB-2018]
MAVRKSGENIAFFFKQWGTWGADEKKRSKHQNGKLLNNKLYQNYPTIPIENRPYCVYSL